MTDPTEGKHWPERDYLPTIPATHVEFTTSRPWCAGHSWAGRNRLAWWMHHVGHRARLLRIQKPPPPRGYVR